MKSWAMALLLLPVLALAADEEKVVEIYEEGERLFKEERYEEALKMLEAAYVMKSDPVLLYNIALCQEKLGRTEQALSRYREYLAQNPEAQNRSKVEHRIQELEATLPGELAVRTEPLGVTVVVDGEERGVSPLVLPLAAGRHVVLLRKEGYGKAIVEVQVVAGRRSSVAYTLRQDQPEPSPQLALPSANPWMPSALSWSLMAVGVAALGGGAISGGLAAIWESDSQDRWATFQDHPSEWALREVNDLEGEAQAAALGANILYVAGGAALTAGLLVWLLSPRDELDTPQAMVGPGGVMVVGRF